MQNKVIAIDGPAGAGKSTVAKKIAERLGFTYIDSGAMYRALTLEIIKSHIIPEDIEKVIRAAQNIEIDFLNGEIFVNGYNVEKQIRQENVSSLVSQIAAITEVRKIMVDKQRKIAFNKNVVMDGRDVGTVIFPNAHKKFYVTADIEERAKRRYSEILKSGSSVNLDDIKMQIEKRDLIDSTRQDSPLKAADDAIYLDTTGKTIDNVVKEVVDQIL